MSYYTVFSPSFSRSIKNDILVFILGSALKLSTYAKVGAVLSGDPAIVQPCVPVLRTLSTSVYRGLKTVKQEQFFRDLVFLFWNANGSLCNWFSSWEKEKAQMNQSSETTGSLCNWFSSWEKEKAQMNQSSETTAKDGTTRNQVFSLLSTIAKVAPDKVLKPHNGYFYCYWGISCHSGL
ncbi:uncharacterized protein LOC130788834 [Actinidia eriantha]|uniref:uncharacterized protein LOC130788834 n=1 Tax=Actinidia eriantha TaxID=165200 RepID=UPI0025874D94|nr:uncharacterized protein LOC130788834 [Actinidia eriantha]